MPKGNLYIDAALTNVAVAYKNTSYIASQILPAVTVGKQGGKVYKFGKDAFKLHSDVRAPGTRSIRVQSYSVASDTYFCDNHAMHDVVPQEDKDNADTAIDPESATTEGLTDLIQLGREKACADFLFNATTFAGYTAALAAADQWDNYAASDPTAKAEEAIELVRQKSGAKANTAIMGAQVYSKLRRHPVMLDMFKYTAGGVLNEAQVAEALGVDRILIGRAVYDSAKEGQAAVMADVWGKFCLFAYIAPRPGLRQPSLGYQYLWNTGVNGFAVYREELGIMGGHGTAIEVMNYFDDIVHGADFGYLFSTVIA